MIMYLFFIYLTFLSGWYEVGSCSIIILQELNQSTKNVVIKKNIGHSIFTQWAEMFEICYYTA